MVFGLGGGLCSVMPYILKSNKSSSDDSNIANVEI